MQWVEIFLWYACNLKCIFCFQKDLRYKYPKFLDKQKVFDIILDWSINKKTSLIFSWGDPLLDPNIQNYIKFAVENWYKDIRIHTNALKLSNIDYFENLVKIWVTWFIFSIHWYWEIHDILVKKTNSFKEVKSALINFLHLKQKYKYLVLDTNTVITKYNLNNLEILFKFLSKFPITRMQIVQLYSLWLYSIEEKRKMYLKYDDIKDKLSNIILKYWKNITLENFPFCEVHKEIFDNISKRQRYENSAYWNIWENLEESSTTYIKKCDSCELKKYCTWYPKDYLKIFNNIDYE